MLPAAVENKILILTVGLPRSGKSTWARKQNLPMVNPDSVRKAIHGQDFIKALEPLVWGIVDTMVRSLFLAGHTVVILDATNSTIATRAKWISREWRTLAKVFDTSIEDCVGRAIAGGRGDLIPVIDRMSKMWDQPVEFDKYQG